MHSLIKGRQRGMAATADDKMNTSTAYEQFSRPSWSCGTEASTEQPTTYWKII